VSIGGVVADLLERKSKRKRRGEGRKRLEAPRKRN